MNPTNGSQYDLGVCVAVEEDLAIIWVWLKGRAPTEEQLDYISAIHPDAYRVARGLASFFEWVGAPRAPATQLELPL